MNYPVWDVPFLGSGLVVAIIAIIHVLISHLAIGGGAFLFVAELWSNRQADGVRVREWLHRYATYFLVYTTVLGAVTGVGIWFAIQLASADATSLLIHQFVFAWATEWVMFLGELSVLYLYYYGWKTNSRGFQTFLAGAYFVIAWLSLFIINGILSFMLTPGAWTLENTDIAAGFFNPGYVPSLLLRTVVMFLLGGLFGIIVGSRLKEDDPLKEKVIAFSTKWALPAAVLAPFLMWWYWTTLPEHAVAMTKGGVAGLGGGTLDAITRHLLLVIVASAAIICGVIVAAVRPKTVRTAGAVALFLIAQFGVLGAEFYREMARKPYVVQGVLYSNGLWASQAKDPAHLAASYAEHARWMPEQPRDQLDHGEWVFRLQCANCHTRDGYRALKKRTESWTYDFGQDWLGRMDEAGVMPPFDGDAADRAALAAYLLSLHSQAPLPTEKADTVAPASDPTEEETP